MFSKNLLYPYAATHHFSFLVSFSNPKRLICLIVCHNKIVFRLQVPFRASKQLAILQVMKMKKFLFENLKNINDSKKIASNRSLYTATALREGEKRYRIDSTLVHLKWISIMQTLKIKHFIVFAKSIRRWNFNMWRKQQWLHLICKSTEQQRTKQFHLMTERKKHM